jgi:hypothetical protein
MAGDGRGNRSVAALISTLLNGANQLQARGKMFIGYSLSKRRN